MNPKSPACDLERLRGLLAGQLVDAAEQEATQHVAECERCQQQLEDLAGDPAWWREMQSGLRSSSVDLVSQPVSASRAGLVPSPIHNADDSFIADFAVAFLEPCHQPGTLGRLEDVEILEVIGQGGMGIVLKGFQRELGRYVAVKVLSPHMAASGAARTRFAREARAAAAVVHPHVMAIHAVHSSGRLPLLVMPYLACESLQQRLDRCGSLDLNEILRIGHQIADGLAAAHAQGLVHRDVKPANILLERGVDRVLLTDFGLARAADDASLTRTGIIAGTPQYMSPEQARGDALDARSDLFSLGSVLYAMAAGRPPFRAETSYGILRRITDTEPHPLREINPAIPAWLDGIIRRLHSKEAAERYGSAAEVATLLSQCLAHVQQPLAVPLPANCVPFLSEGVVPMSTGALFGRRIGRWVRRLTIIASCFASLFSAFWINWKLMHTEWRIAANTLPGTEGIPSTKFAPAQSRNWTTTTTKQTQPVAEIAYSELEKNREPSDIDLGQAVPPPRFAPAAPAARVQDPLVEPPPAEVLPLPASPPVIPRQVSPMLAKTVVSGELPKWDGTERGLKQFSESLGALEKQNWLPSKFPVVHAPRTESLEHR